MTAVAHSMGGNVLTRAVQEAPELFAHAVYVTAFMPASGVPAAAYILAPENEGDLARAALVVAPAAIGLLHRTRRPTAVHTLDSSHSPFLSVPGELTDIILEV